MSMIREYKNDLKELRQNHKTITDIDKDVRSSDDERDKSIIAGAITSTEYALFWIENSFERPVINSPSKPSKGNREQLWGNVEHSKGIEQGVCDTYFWEDSENSALTDKQLDMLQDATTILNSFSNQELTVFLHKFQDLMEVEEIAIITGLTEKAVYKTVERITTKIDQYFSSQTSQLALFC